MLHSSKSAFLSGCFLLTQDCSGSSVFHFDVLLLRGIRGATYHHHLLRVKNFPGFSPFLNASFWVSWVWMVSQCPPKRWPGGWYCYHSWTIKVHLEAQVALPDGLSPHSAWRLTVHTGLLDAHLPLLKLLHHPLDCLFPQGHAPYLAWTLTLHPPAIPRGFSRNERGSEPSVWANSMHQWFRHPVQVLTPLPSVTARRLTAYPVTVCSNKS